MPDDKDGDELLKKAQKADAYQEAMAKKAEQSRLLRLQEGIPSGKKPPVPEEAVEEASEKRKAPFMYRPDYKPEKKLTEEEEVVRGMIIEGYPGITKSSRSGSLEDRLTFSADDQLKNAKEELERQYKLEDISLGAEMVKKQTAINKEDDRRREAWRRREAEYIKQEQQGKGSLLAFRRLLKARSPYYGEARKMDVHPHPAYTMKARKETFLEFLLRREQLWKNAKQRRRDEALPARKPQPGDEAYYFGKEKK